MFLFLLCCKFPSARLDLVTPPSITDTSIVSTDTQHHSHVTQSETATRALHTSLTSGASTLHTSQSRQISPQPYQLNAKSPSFKYSPAMELATPLHPRQQHTTPQSRRSTHQSLPTAKTMSLSRTTSTRLELINSLCLANSK